MNINQENNLMFFHIPKNAGQSILSGFNLEKNKQLNRSVVCGLTTSLFFKQEELNRFTKFSIIRNPFDRLVSLYHFRKKENDLYNLFVGANYSGGDKTSPDGKNLSFKEWVMDSRSRGLGLLWGEDPFLDSSKEKQIYLFENHQGGYNSTIEWVNQIHFLTDKSGNLITNEILRFETLNDDINNFCKKYNLNNLKLEKKNSSPRKKNYVDYYDDELIEYASKLFKDDIECLGYEFGE